MRRTEIVDCPSCERQFPIRRGTRVKCLCGRLCQIPGDVISYVEKQIKRDETRVKNRRVKGKRW